MVNSGMVLLIFKKKLTYSPKSDEKVKNKNLNSHQTTENEIIKLSINLFRASVFIISSVTIFAVNFKVYPLIHVKKKRFGLSLMDLGVGLFIFCNSMRVIRNSSNEVALDSFEK